MVILNDNTRDKRVWIVPMPGIWTVGETFTDNAGDTWRIVGFDAESGFPLCVLDQ